MGLTPHKLAKFPVLETFRPTNTVKPKTISIHHIDRRARVPDSCSVFRCCRCFCPHLVVLGVSGSRGLPVLRMLLSFCYLS